jgi:hypothetical protein
VTQDGAGEPKDLAPDKARAGAPEPAPPGTDPVLDKVETLARTVLRWIVHFLYRWVVTAIGLLVVATLFTYVLPGEELLKAFQERLKYSIDHINPIALLDYVGNFGVTVWTPVQGVFDGFFGAVSDAVDWLLSFFQDAVSPGVAGLLRFVLILLLSPLIITVAIVMAAGAFAVLGLAVLFSPVIVTIAVIRNGNLIEAVLVLLVFLPLIWLLARLVIGGASADLNLKERAGLLWLGTWMALGITTLFYTLVNLVMLGAGWAFSGLTELAPTAGAAGGIFAFCYECTKRTLEESVTEGAAEIFKSPEPASHAGKGRSGKVAKPE